LKSSAQLRDTGPSLNESGILEQNAASATTDEENPS
jgi:hypothetical protein